MFIICIFPANSAVFCRWKTAAQLIQLIVFLTAIHSRKISWKLVQKLLSYAADTICTHKQLILYLPPLRNSNLYSPYNADETINVFFSAGRNHLDRQSLTESHYSKL